MWESEGHDRANIDLPPGQDELIRAVAAVNPNTVVVVNAGAPVAMPWRDEVAGIVQLWYLGQEAGNALADVLTGAVDASGRLPTTFAHRLEDIPAMLNYPGENGEVLYGEGLFVGYRAFDKTKTEPLFPFGFGLSYTTFTFGEPTASATTVGPGSGLTVSVPVTNTGARAGDCVVQLYVRDVESSLVRPEKELKGFAPHPPRRGCVRDRRHRARRARLPVLGSRGARVARRGGRVRTAASRPQPPTCAGTSASSGRSDGPSSVPSGATAGTATPLRPSPATPAFRRTAAR